ncbi:MAG TPA: ATP-binding protein [Pirellulales bacterium]|jgi:signal transduction histidine kinase|nr:ATP-binding protein [Pirellulales bacterium]
MGLRLGTKFSWTIFGIVAISILSSLVALYAAWRVNKRLEETARESFPNVRAEEAEIILRERNGLIASYLLDKGNPVWEQRFRDLQRHFQSWITTVRETTYVPEEEEALLLQLERTWTNLSARQEEVISLFRKGEEVKARTLLLNEVNGRLSNDVHDLCDQLIAVNDLYVKAIIARAETRMQVTFWVVGISGILSLVLGGFLLWLFFYRVLFPLRGMVADARLFHGDHRDSPADSDQDELRMIGNHFRDLMSDVSDARSRLDRSHDRLMAAEKLASVGKLAASVAHEIRNPLTAIKMWLFSIQETARGNVELNRKLRIVSEETTRLESIVRSFLEFSRPPALRCQPQNVGAVIEQTLELLRLRLEEGAIGAEHATREDLPPIMADAAQLKQVFLNLLGNAADAMTGGGEIRITATAENDADGRPMVVVRIRDTGAGMPQDVQRRIFEPFFTTKETGTGLGLCISAQVMARHGGALVLESSTDKGTTFAVWVPIAREESDGQNPYC